VVPRKKKKGKEVPGRHPSNLLVGKKEKKGGSSAEHYLSPLDYKGTGHPSEGKSPRAFPGWKENTKGEEKKEGKLVNRRPLAPTNGGKKGKGEETDAVQ